MESGSLYSWCGVNQVRIGYHHDEKDDVVRFRLANDISYSNLGDDNTRA